MVTVPGGKSPRPEKTPKTPWALANGRLMPGVRLAPGLICSPALIEPPASLVLPEPVTCRRRYPLPGTHEQIVVAKVASGSQFCR